MVRHPTSLARSKSEWSEVGGFEWRDRLSRRSSISWHLVARSLPNRRKIDAVQDQRKLGSADLDACPLIGRRSIRQLVTAPLQLLVPDTKARAAPIQKLDAVAAAIDEDKKMARKRILLQHRLGQADQPVEALAVMRCTA